MQSVSVEIFTAGDGIRYPKKGQTVTIHYTAYLADGTQWDSSRSRGKPFKFKLGAEQVIPGATGRGGRRFRSLTALVVAARRAGRGRVAGAQSGRARPVCRPIGAFTCARACVCAAEHRRACKDRHPARLGVWQAWFPGPVRAARTGRRGLVLGANSAQGWVTSSATERLQHRLAGAHGRRFGRRSVARQPPRLPPMFGLPAHPARRMRSAPAQRAPQLQAHFRRRADHLQLAARAARPPFIDCSVSSAGGECA